MNTSMKLAGAGVAACAACCAVSVVPALLAGTSLLAIGGAASAWGVGIAALTVPVALLYFLARRKSLATANFQALMTGDKSCGCGPSCASPNDAPIACTLDAGDFKERAAGIRDLARRSLRQASRTPLTLTLTYGPEAADEVRELVAKEQECCAFLAFDLKTNAGATLLTITAPKSAADAADMLFNHFAPELATSNPKEIA